MKMRKFVTVVLASFLLISSMMISASAKVSVFEDFDKYANDIAISAQWRPHVATKKLIKLALSDDTPYKSSQKSMVADYDVTKTGWTIVYYDFIEPDKVEYGEYITFLAKANTNLKLGTGLINKDIGYGKKIDITTEWKRYSIPLSEYSDDSKNLLEGIEKDSLWLSNFAFNFDTKDNPGLDLKGKIWIDDIAFASKTDLSSLPNVEKQQTTRALKTDPTQKPTTMKPTTATSPKSTKTDSATELTTSPSEEGTSSFGESSTVTNASVQEDALLTVLDPLIRLDAEELIVPSGMTVSNVLSRLKVKSDHSLAIIKEDATVENAERVSSDMILTVNEKDTVVKSYRIVVDSKTDTPDVSAKNSWILPVCIAAGIVILAGVLAFVFRKQLQQLLAKLFHKA